MPWIKMVVEKQRSLLIDFASRRYKIEKECLECEGYTLEEVLAMKKTITWMGPMNKTDSRTFIFGEIVDIEDCDSYIEFVERVNKYIGDFKQKLRNDMLEYMWRHS